MTISPYKALSEGLDFAVTETNQENCEGFLLAVPGRTLTINSMIKADS